MTANVTAQLSVALETFKMVDIRQMRAKTAARQVENIHRLISPVEGEKRLSQQNIFYSPLINLVGLRQLVVLRLADADAEATSYGVIRYDIPTYAAASVEEVAALLTTSSGDLHTSVTLERALELITEATNRLELVHAS